MAAGDQDRKDFFISYNSRDESWAEWLAWQLEEAGYTTFLQAWDFTAGGNFVQKMDEGARSCERTIAALSPNYLASKFTKPEWYAAFARDPTGEKGFLVPVRIAKCDLDGLLGQIIYIDLVGLDEEPARERFLARIKGTRAKPSRPPRFPGSGTATATAVPRFPGALPKVWPEMPARNPHFTGRGETIERLRASLTGGHATAVTQKATVHGLGGIGKSELAIEYAYRFHTDYDAGAWLRAETPATLAADYAGLAAALDLPEKDRPEQAVVIEAVRRWCEGHDRWLLIFDNAEAPADLKDFLPRGGGGHVVITSRNPAWGRVAEALPVDLWPRAQSISFLMQRTKSADATAADTIAGALGDLPLALGQAAAYCEETGITLARYAGLLEQGHGAALRTTGGEPERSVAAVWDLSLKRIAENAPAAAQLLNLIAFFAPERIPLDVIRDGRDLLPEPLAGACADPIAFDQTVAALRRYSLVRREDETLTIHRLVQAVTRDRMEEAGEKTWAEAAAAIISARLPPFPDNAWDPVAAAAYARLDGHAEQAATLATREAVASRTVMYLFYQIGFYNQLLANLDRAKAMHQRSLAIAESAFGPDHPMVATCLNSVGGILLQDSDPRGAKTYFERALAIDEKAFGPHDTRVATRLMNLGRALHELGDLNSARKLCVRALRIDLKTLGENDPMIANRLNALGGVLLNLGDLPGATNALERALAIDERHFGGDHPNVARDFNGLGLLLRVRGDLEGARAHVTRALSIARKYFPETHPDVKLYRDNLAHVEALLAARGKKP